MGVAAGNGRAFLVVQQAGKVAHARSRLSPCRLAGGAKIGSAVELMRFAAIPSQAILLSFATALRGALYPGRSDLVNSE
jgi:hypothetical protein